MEQVVPPLLAVDVREVIFALGGLVALILWVINQISEGKKALGRPPAKRPEVPRPAPAQPAGGERLAGAQPRGKLQAAGGLRGEVEDFLRRAAAQQQGGQVGQAKRPAVARKPQAPPPADQIEVLVDERGRKIERRRPAMRTRPVEPRPAVSKKQSSQPAAKTPRRAVAVPREPLIKRESIGEQVRQIETAAQELGVHASQLGMRIVKEDKEFDVQLKAKFDHEVGTLASKERVTDTPSQLQGKSDEATPASQLAALLANPVGVQQAVLMNEILRRPSERW